MSNNFYFRGPGFEFGAAGPFAILAAVLLVIWLTRGYFF
jgi:hypothetical protein